jgi:Ca2+-binding RTX toxin-like protein
MTQSLNLSLAGTAWNAGAVTMLPGAWPQAPRVVLAGLADGGIGVAWSELGETFRVAALDSDNNLSMPGIDQPGAEPAIAALAGGGFVVAGASFDGSNTAFFVQAFTPAGVAVAPAAVAGLTGTGLTGSDIAAFGDGYVLVWEPEILLGDDAGTPPVLIGGDLPDVAPAVAVLANGGLVVTWQRDDTSFARLIGADLQPLAEEFQVGSGVATDPDAAALAGGGFVIAWDSSSFSGAPDGSIMVRRHDADGVALGSDIIVDAGTGRSQDKVTVTALADGGFVVGWTEYADTGSYGLYLRIFSAEGEAVSPRLTIAQGLDPFAAPPELQTTALASEGFAVAWTEDGEVLVRRFELASRPTAVADTTATGADVPLLIAPLGNDVAATAAALVLRDASAESGSVTLNGDATLTYTPSAGWSGVDTIRYTVASADGGADVGAISVLVGGPAPASFAAALGGFTLAATGGAAFDRAQLLALIASDPEATAEALDILAVDAVSGGTALLGPSAVTVDGPAGTLELDISVDYAGGDTGTYRATVAMLEASAGDDVLTVAAGTALSILDGGEGNDVLTGAEGEDHLSGGGGNDTLDGGAGADVLTGGNGNDTYVIDAEDLVIEAADGGTDRIIAAETTFLADDIEELELAAAAGDAAGFGNDLDNLILGNDGANELFGLAGNDVLIGGAGDDTLTGDAGFDLFVGGAGNDSFAVDDAAELVFEDEDGGHDTVASDASHYLYANVEDLWLTEAAGDGFGVGNALANALDGNGGDNLLIGGTGNDRLSGHAGNDALFGESDADTLLGGSGIDYLVGGSGNDSLDGEGDADALYGEDGDDLLRGGSGFATDILVGGAGADTLDGASGLGDYDLMDGGAGDDLYRVDTPDDLTFEAADGGIDTVHASITGAGYYLYAFVENLVLEGETPFGVGNELDNRLTGSATANWLLGGAGDDILNGMAGNDVLFGEAGADSFVFAPGTGGDVIGDFETGVDRIDLSAFGLADFEALQSALVENDGTTAISLGDGDFIVLNGVANAQLTAADFIFG